MKEVNPTKELDDIKLIRKNEMIKAAKTVFIKKGIDATKMTDVAEEAGVGVASVYRYFKTKTDLAIAVAINVWDDDVLYIVHELMTVEFHQLTGIEQAELIHNFYTELYLNRREFFTFIHDFDAYMVRERVSKERLTEYEKNLDVVNHLLIESLEKGQRDGTIRLDLDPKTYYMTVTHALMSLTQKLSVAGDILHFDQETNHLSQIQLLINMAISYLKK